MRLLLAAGGAAAALLATAAVAPARPLAAQARPDAEPFSVVEASIPELRTALDERDQASLGL